MKYGKFRGKYAQNIQNHKEMESVMFIQNIDIQTDGNNKV